MKNTKRIEEGEKKSNSNNQKQAKQIGVVVLLFLLITGITMTCCFSAYKQTKKTEQNQMKQNQILQEAEEIQENQKTEKIVVENFKKSESKKEQKKEKITKNNKNNENNEKVKTAKKQKTTEKTEQIVTNSKVNAENTNKNIGICVETEKTTEKVTEKPVEKPVEKPQKHSVDMTALVPAQEIKKPEEVAKPEKKNKRIVVAGVPYMTFKAGETKQEVNLKNDILNEGVCSMEYHLYIDKNNNKNLDDADTCVCVTERINPGENISEIELKEPLEAGTYTLFVFCKTYSLENGKEMNNALMKVELTVV